MNAVDTDVLVHACDQSAGARQQTALDLIHETADCVLLWQVACEFVSASRKLASQNFTPTEAWQRLDTYLKLMQLVVPTAEVLEQARELHVVRQCAFWDALIYAACREAGVTRIYSEDLPGAPLEGLEVVNPFTDPPSAAP